MKNIQGCMGAIGVFVWFFVLIYFSFWGMYETFRWGRFRRKRWFFAKPSLIKLANRASGQKIEGGFVEVVGLLNGHPCPEALICKISSVKPIKPKRWPILERAASGELVYGYTPGMPFGEIRNLKETLLSLKEIYIWDKEAPWDHGSELVQ